MVLGYSAVNPKCIKEIPENFHYYEPEKTIKLDKKNKIIRIVENVNETVKYFLK